MRHAKLDKILSDLQVELRQILGERLEAIYLYGSQARGDARFDSDIDVLIIMKGKFDYFQLLELTSEITWRISLENDVVVTRAFVTKKQFDESGTPFLINAQKEAVLV